MDIKIQLGAAIQEAQLLDRKKVIVSSKEENDLLRLFDKCKNLLRLLKESHPGMFDDIEIDENFSIKEHETKGNYYADKRIEKLKTTLSTCLKIIDNNGKKNEFLNNQALNILEQIAQKFPIAVRQLKDRRSNKPSFEIEDEYDVQDIFRCFLFLFFEDVRKENSSPEFAGSNSRIDFVLPKEKIAVEIKKTRNGLDAKALGEELAIDIAKYKKHPDVELLFCFVYDIEHKIYNPIAIENDLAKDNSTELRVIVRIFPK